MWFILSFVGISILLASYYIAAAFREITFDHFSGCIIWRSGSKGFPTRVLTIPKTEVQSVHVYFECRGIGPSLSVTPSPGYDTPGKHVLSIVLAGKDIELHGDYFWGYIVTLATRIKEFTGLSSIIYHELGETRELDTLDTL